MKIISFKDFINDYREYYNVHDFIKIGTESDMQEVLYDIYNTDQFEIDYENKLIELY